MRAYLKRHETIRAMSVDPGPLVQNAIYLAGGGEWPVSADGWEARARAARAGAVRLRRGRRRLRGDDAGEPRGVRAAAPAAADARRHGRARLSVEVLGLRSPVPFLLAPVGVLSILHPDAELAVARASVVTGVPMILSSAASTPLEAVAEVGPPRWFQLYWWGDDTLAESLVRRAEAAGYGAIVLTVDTLNLGWRDRDLANGYLPFLQGQGLAQSSATRSSASGWSRRPRTTSSPPRCRRSPRSRTSR